MKLNHQPIEKAELQTGLDVHSIFYTLQGEGPFAGTPAVFIRLAGCNLCCPLCDTDYTSNRERLDVDEIVTRVLRLLPDRRGLVVVTGGEPFRQSLVPLFKELVKMDCFVQVETNGTLEPEDYAYTCAVHQRRGVYIVCSPKTGKVNQYTAAVACCYKYVMCHDDVYEVDGLPVRALDHTVKSVVARPPYWRSNIPIYLQPADEQDEERNALNLKACVYSCLMFGYTLQIQLHKHLGMD